MNRDAYLRFHENFCNASRALSAQKNNDYAGKDGEEPFANFTRVEALGICSTEQGFLVRLTDKLSRLSTLAAGGKLQVSDETAEDTLKDVVNYAILLAAYMADTANTKLPPKAPNVEWVTASGSLNTPDQSW
jgi:hypothetical protein